MLKVTGRPCLLVFIASLLIGQAMAAEPPKTFQEVKNDLVVQQKIAEQELQKALETALAKMPRIDQFDMRKSQAQLLKAQVAWKKFTVENCLYLGGQRGGGNFWVSEQADECILSATKARVKFLLENHVTN